MNYTIQDIAEIIKASKAQYAPCQVSVLLTDSRSLTFPTETLFFALVTSRNNGHIYLQDLYNKGVRNFVVSELPKSMQNFEGANMLLVSDTLKALQRLAAIHRRKFDMPVVAITGSNGKTVVKEWLYQLLQEEYAIVRSPRSYNSQIGVPLSVWQMNGEANLAIFEAGISQPKEMATLEAIIKPKVGVLTNIGMAHHEGFTSLQEKCMEKLSLFTDSDVIIYDGDNPMISACVEQLGIGTREIAWSKVDRERPLFISKIEKYDTSTTITFFYLQSKGSITIPFLEDASIENAIHCLAVMAYMGKLEPKLLQRMQQLRPVAMRLEVKEGRNGSLIIDDSYNSDVNSLEIALDFHLRRSVDSGLKKTLILSDIHQSGLTDNQLYRRVADLLEHKQIERFVAIGERLFVNQSHFVNLPQTHFYKSTREFLLSEQLHTFVNEQILIKGAREFDFAQISDALELKQHETILEVDLNAIAYNYHQVKSRLKPSTQIVCMVKAFGYGAGSYELAKTLQECGCNYLAVAVADEGVALRKAGITMPIMVMNPESSSFRLLFKYSLEPEIYSFKLLQSFVNEAEKLGITKYPVHIKIDSGMHRLGFTYSECAKLATQLKQEPAVMVRSLFTHLAGSDSNEFDAFTHQQIELFMRSADLIQEQSKYKIYRHILNTAGILRFPEYQLDMVRLGIGLYGIDPTTGNNDLHTVSTLKTIILQIKEIPQNETVGYSRRGELKRNSRVAAIPIGYADGLNRKLGNGVGRVAINGHFAPIIGNICMDVCMIDVTDIACKEGDVVEIFGNNISVNEIAQKLDTIPYEVITSISDRVKRVYFHE